MPRIDHAALWVADLEATRDFYLHWFGGHANGQYHNPRTGLRTYILNFDDGARAAGRRGTRLELMSRPDVVTHPDTEMCGWAHISFALPDRAGVDDLAARARAAGVSVIDGPRQTGDGYYEAVLLDPEGNRVEVVAGDYSDEVAQRR
ncbi:VOC family protein [Actinomyces qiguomingii]|uniref:VOC family protein n=1 Tax=Actinomyces qiguomingii TaxID=2057800 RepID=UPI000CA0580B|nr:VOC family protein [Actinomyces qiguomingii]